MDEDLFADFLAPMRLLPPYYCDCWCHKPEYWGHHWDVQCCAIPGAWSLEDTQRIHPDGPEAMPLRVLVTGDRKWTDEAMVHEQLQHYFDWRNELIVIEGCAPGADRAACRWTGMPHEHLHYPADWNRYKKGAGPIRNRQMLTEGRPNLVLAFHDDLYGGSRGTLDMVTISLAAGVPVKHFSHNGNKVLPR